MIKITNENKQKHQNAYVNLQKNTYIFCLLSQIVRQIVTTCCLKQKDIKKM